MTSHSAPGDPRALRPAQFCRELLRALEASDGRRRRRSRDTTPDAIGLALERALLERAAQDDPAPDDFERWLLERCIEAGQGAGGIRAVARSIFEQWVFAAEEEDFRAWLAAGARSDDRLDPGPGVPPRHPRLPCIALALTCALALGGAGACQQDARGRHDVFARAGRIDTTIAAGAVVRDLRAPPDSVRLIYTRPTPLHIDTATVRGAPPISAHYGIARPDTAHPHAAPPSR